MHVCVCACVCVRVCVCVFKLVVLKIFPWSVCSADRIIVHLLLCYRLKCVYILVNVLTYILQ